MPNATVRANAQAMPIDRRAALGALAAGALLATAHHTQAAAVDAELLSFSKKAQQLNRSYERSVEALGAALDRMVEPPLPPALIFTERDGDHFPRIELPVGMELVGFYVEKIRRYRETYVEIFDIIDWDSREPRPGAREMLQRAVEIENAFDLYKAAMDRAREAAGVTEANEECARLERELGRTWSILARMAARSVEGVVAKISAVATNIGEPHVTDEWPDEVEAEEVLQRAAIDLAAILRQTEA